VLRIWVKSSVLFEKDANGEERLTDDGRARLDSAMSQFIRYPAQQSIRGRRLRRRSDQRPAVPSQP
jgi:hypothetical protein